MKKGFTLLELLVVVAIIMLLAGLLFPAFNAARTTARKAKAKADVKQLDIAFKAVLLDYRGWSAAGIPVNNSGMDVAVAYLGGGNTKKIVYMEFDSASLKDANGNVTGNFYDPWKQIYQVALGDGDPPLTPPGSLPVARQVAAWSWGVKGKAKAKSEDWVKSWE